MENIAQFFADRGMKLPGQAPAQPPPQSQPQTQPPAKTNVYPPKLSSPTPPGPPQQQRAAAPPPRKRSAFAAGSVIRHPKFGRGTILRREGDGDDARLTVSFPGHGLKKLVQKYAGISSDE
jgi:DNA helicase-2/ATP-dependent DNA helicase PcrA